MSIPSIDIKDRNIQKRKKKDKSKDSAKAIRDSQQNEQTTTYGAT
jgi:hypothetical protein